MENFPLLGVNMDSIPQEQLPSTQQIMGSITQMIHDYENEGMAETVPFTHMLTALMMEIFAPGFIIIGSPMLIKSEDGIDLPADCGFIINGRTNLTASTVGHFLGLLSDLIDETTENGLVDLTSIYEKDEE